MRADDFRILPLQEPALSLVFGQSDRALIRLVRCVWPVKATKEVRPDRVEQAGTIQSSR